VDELHILKLMNNFLANSTKFNFTLVWVSTNKHLQARNVSSGIQSYKERNSITFCAYLGKSEAETLAVIEKRTERRA
jgi:hypothetical protein